MVQGHVTGLNSVFIGLEKKSRSRGQLFFFFFFVIFLIRPRQRGFVINEFGAAAFEAPESLPLDELPKTALRRLAEATVSRAS